MRPHLFILGLAATLFTACDDKGGGGDDDTAGGSDGAADGGDGTGDGAGDGGGDGAGDGGDDVDVDGDGYPEDLDCDDNNGDINPGATEVCDTIDNDCDLLVDDADDSLDLETTTAWYTDADGDGHGLIDSPASLACIAPDATAAVADDCDDDNSAVHPDQLETCDDGFDNTCSAAIDCDDTDCTADAACVPLVDTIAPASGYYAASTAVTLTGSGFGYATAGTPTVTFGGTSAADVVVVDDATVTCTAPPATAPGSVDVELVNSNGAVTLTDGFEYTSCIYVADGAEGTAGSLWCVDVDGGTVTEVGAIGYGVSAMAFAPDGTLYAITSTRLAAAVELITIDTATGVGTPVATIFDETTTGTGGYSAACPDMTFVGSNLVAWTESYYYADGGYSYDSPLLVDTATGGATELTSSPGTGSANTALAADAAGNVYLLNSGLRSNVYSLNATTGVATSLVSISNSASSYGRSGGATFHNGQLYSLDCGKESGCSIGTVDVTTGVYTNLGIEISTTGMLDAIASPSL